MNVSNKARVLQAQDSALRRGHSHLEDTIWMTMKLIQMKWASLRVRLSRWESGQPWMRLSVRSPMKDPHPAWLPPRKKFSGNPVWAQAQAPLLPCESLSLQPERSEIDQAKWVCVWSGSWEDDSWWRSMSVPNKTQAKNQSVNRSSKYFWNIFAALMEKRSQSLGLDILVDIVLALWFSWWVLVHGTTTDPVLRTVSLYRSVCKFFFPLSTCLAQIQSIDWFTVPLHSKAIIQIYSFVGWPVSYLVYCRTPLHLQTVEHFLKQFRTNTKIQKSIASNSP